MSPSPKQPLSRQGVRRISGYKFKNIQIGIKPGTWNVGSLCGRGTEVTKELRKIKVGICGLQGVQWRRQEAPFIEIEGRYKLW